MHDDQAAPQWTPPTPSLYENKMIVMVRLQDELAAYSTADDLMAVFVGDECRALSTRGSGGEKVYFVLNIYGNATSSPEYFTICYYSSGLQQLFRLSGYDQFSSELNWGTGGDFVPDLMQGATKYAQRTILTINAATGTDIPTDAASDLVAVFVGGKCRGTGRPGEPFTVYHQSGERAQLRYYSAGSNGYYIQQATVPLAGDAQTATFNF